MHYDPLQILIRVTASYVLIFHGIKLCVLRGHRLKYLCNLNTSAVLVFCFTYIELLNVATMARAPYRTSLHYSVQPPTVKIFHLQLLLQSKQLLCSIYNCFLSMMDVWWKDSWDKNGQTQYTSAEEFKFCSEKPLIIFLILLSRKTKFLCLRTYFCTSFPTKFLNKCSLRIEIEKVNHIFLPKQTV